MRKKHNLLFNYRKVYDFFREIKWHFVLSMGIFFLLLVVGFTLPIFFREQILNLISQLSSSIESKNLAGIITFIFLNNLRSSFFAFIFGIFLGIFPVVALVVNGYLLGFVLRLSAEEKGILTFWKILPHGVFELPAIFLSTAVGIKIGTDLFKRKKNISKNYREGLRFFILVVIPLLVIAAIIEGSLIWFLK